MSVGWFFVIMPQISSIILAAGYGTRMNSALPKVLHQVCGRALIEWSINAAQAVCNDLPTVIVGHGKESVQVLLQNRATFVEQKEILGTGHAVQQARSLLKGRSNAVVVTYGDMPLLQGETLQKLAKHFWEQSSSANLALSMLTIRREDPQGFGRVLRDDNGNVLAVVEEADCTPDERTIQELNTGVYCFDADWLWENSPKIQLSAKGEYYLTDLVAMATADGRAVTAIEAPLDEVSGINTRVHLANAEAIMRWRILEQHMLGGVTIVDPTATYIQPDVVIGADTIIHPGSVLETHTQIGERCTIGPNAHIIQSTIGNGCTIRYAFIEQAEVGNACEIGPFARLRKGAILADNVHMGNFGEVKNSYIGPGTKMGHFSYIGDAELGSNVNVGAGTITCNYDGQRKHKTRIGQDAFLGSDTLLVAPVDVGAGAQTGAGSVVTRDVPADTLVYGVPARPAAKNTK